MGFRRIVTVLLVVSALLAAGAWASGGRPVVRVECGEPARLRLERYEDGSARLLCGRRVLARIAVPW